MQFMATTPFEELKRLATESGIPKSLDFLEHFFRRDKEFFKLFEVLKMRCRHKLDLPLMYSEQPDDLTSEQQQELEDGLLDACREVGTLLIRSGQLQEGWMYLQPVGDKKLSDGLIRSVKPNDENLDQLIEIAVTQGAAPVYGYELLLKHYGTCNGITTFDTQASRFDKPTQRLMAKAVLSHLHDELMENVGYSITQAGGEVQGRSLEQLMDENPDLLVGGAHHIDTTHLASVMRIARFTESVEDWGKAAAMARYGLALDKDFHYPGNPPFEDTYQDHLHFFNALLGKDVDQAIAHFEQKLKSVDVHEFGPVAHESLIELLVRIGRKEEAVDLSLQHLLGKHEPMGIAPTPFEIVDSESQQQKLMKFYESQDDLLGFAVSLLNGAN